MNPEVQVGLIVTLRSVTTSQRREESNRRRDERKEIYIGFLDATEEMISAVEECQRLRSERPRAAPDDVELPTQVTLEHDQYRRWRRDLQKARYAFTEVARTDLGVPRSPSR